MKKSGTFIFKDSNKLLEMLMLRRQGWTFYALAELYNCDRTSLRYQCRKYQIFPIKTIQIRNDKSKEIFDPRRIVTQIIIEIQPLEQEKQWIIIGDEKINTGKSYADYLKNISPYKTH